MKCAKCGNEVSADAPCCPWCAAGAEPLNAERAKRDKRYCPVCGAAGKTVDKHHVFSGCGCLGLPLMLLGLGRLFTGEREDMHCENCGADWVLQRPAVFSGQSGCMFLLILMIIIFMVL